MMLVSQIAILPMSESRSPATKTILFDDKKKQPLANPSNGCKIQYAPKSLQSVLSIHVFNRTATQFCLRPVVLAALWPSPQLSTARKRAFEVNIVTLENKRLVCTRLEAGLILNKDRPTVR